MGDLLGTAPGPLVVSLLGRLAGAGAAADAVPSSEAEPERGCGMPFGDDCGMLAPWTLSKSRGGIEPWIVVEPCGGFAPWAVAKSPVGLGPWDTLGLWLGLDLDDWRTPALTGAPLNWGGCNFGGKR